MTASTNRTWQRIREELERHETEQIRRFTELVQEIRRSHEELRQRLQVVAADGNEEVIPASDD